MLHLQTFGTLDLREDARSLTAILAQPKRAALLAYLVIARPRDYHRRDSLLALFWPELDQRRGRNALSQTLTFLRRELSDPAVLVARGAEEIGVDHRRVRCDVVSFEEALAKAQWAQALELYRGDLLAGVHISGSAFDDWLDGERQRLRDEAARAAWALARDRAAAGELEEAERAAQQALRLAPTSEGSVRAHMQALAAAGESAAALRFYERFGALLTRDLELEPSPETKALAEAVRRGAFRPAAGIPRVPKAVGSGVGSRHGRDAGGAEPPVGQPPDDVAHAGHPSESARERRSRRMPIAVGVTLVLAGLPAVLAWPGGPEAPVPQPGGAMATTIIVADIATPDTLLGATAAAWLRSLLDEAPGLRALKGEPLADALRRMRQDPMRPVEADVALELAIREGYAAVLAGEIEEVDGRYRIMMRLLSAPHGELLAEIRDSAAGPGRVLDALGRIADGVRRHLGPEPVGAPPPALGRVTTPSLEALMAFTEGDRLRYHAADPAGAIPFYERAIALDSTFAMAYSRLGMAWNRLEGGPTSDTVAALWRRAAEHAGGLTPNELLQVQEGLIFAGPPNTIPDGQEYERAVQLFQDYVRLYPHDGTAQWNLAWFLRHMDRWAEAEAPARRAIELGADVVDAYNELALALIAVGKDAAADSALRKWRERHGASPRWYVAAYRLATARGDYEAGDSVLAEAGREPGHAAPSMLAVYGLAIRGRLREAEEHLRRLSVTHEVRGQRANVVRGASWLGALQANVAGDTAGALGMLRATLEQHPLSDFPPERAPFRLYVDLGIHLAMLGDTAGAHFALGSVWRNAYFYRLDNLIRGYIAAAAGRHEEAIRELEQFRYLAAHLPPLGRAYEAIGAADSAIAAYERFLDMRDADYPAWHAVHLPEVLERLGAVYIARGDSARAAERYATLADLWHDADPELRWRADRARSLAIRYAPKTAPRRRRAARLPP